MCSQKKEALFSQLSCASKLGRVVHVDSLYCRCKIHINRASYVAKALNCL